MEKQAYALQTALRKGAAAIDSIMAETEATFKARFQGTVENPVALVKHLRYVKDKAEQHSKMCTTIESDMAKSAAAARAATDQLEAGLKSMQACLELAMRGGGAIPNQ